MADKKETKLARLQRLTRDYLNAADEFESIVRDGIIGPIWYKASGRRNEARTSLNIELKS